MRSVVAAVALAAGACGAVAPAGLAAPPQSLSIHARKHLVAYTRGARIHGRLSSGKRGVEVAILADRFPFKGFRRVATTTTQDGGRYRFAPRPQLGTRYRAALAKRPAVHSGTTTVYVRGLFKDFSCTPCGSDAPPKPGRHTFHEHYTEYFPPSARVGSRPKYFYWGQRNGSTKPPSKVKLVKTVSPHVVRPGKIEVRIRYRFDVPDGSWNYYGVACTREHFASNGFGKPGHHHCGDRSIPRPAYLHYLG